MEGVDERGRVEEHGAVGQVDLALPDGGEVVLGDAGLADRPSRQVQDVVVVGHDLEEERKETIFVKSALYSIQSVALGCFQGFMKSLLGNSIGWWSKIQLQCSKGNI